MLYLFLSLYLVIKLFKITILLYKDNLSVKTKTIAIGVRVKMELQRTETHIEIRLRILCLPNLIRNVTSVPDLGFRVQTLVADWCLVDWRSLHLLCVRAWVSSRHPGFLQQLKPIILNCL